MTVKSSQSQQPKKRKQGQGQRANKNGKSLETRLKRLMRQSGLKVVSGKDWNPKTMQNVLVTNYGFTTVYGCNGRRDFMICSKKFNVRMWTECRSQKKEGSVDEKFPYMVQNFLHAEDGEFHNAVILEGAGFRPGAVGWLKNAAKSINTCSLERKLEVFESFESFEEWWLALTHQVKSKKRATHAVKTIKQPLLISP